MLTAIAIDDEPVALAVIENHASRVPFLEMKGFFTNAFEAIDFLSKEKVDLLFIDFKMPDISGLDFIGSLPNPPMTVFTTAYSEHAVKSFELDAIDYLLKPFSLIRFMKACNKANSLLQLKQQQGTTALVKEPEYIFIKSGYEQFRVKLEDILYLESAGNYVNFVLTDKKLISRLSMQEAIDLLPVNTFTRVHRSYIVANNKIERADRNSLYICNVPIPIGAAYATAIEKIFSAR